MSDVATPVLTALEPRMVALYEAIFEEVGVGTGTHLLDVGRGHGLFARLAAQRGAMVTVTDALASLDDDTFDVVTALDVIDLASLREAGRVARTGASIVIATWGRPERCEAAAYVTAVSAPTDDPFALSAPGALEALAARAGLEPQAPSDVACIWSFPDAETLLQVLVPPRGGDGAGEERLAAAVLEAVAPYRTSDGGYRLENVFTYLVAHPWPAARRDAQPASRPSSPAR